MSLRKVYFWVKHTSYETIYILTTASFNIAGVLHIYPERELFMTSSNPKHGKLHTLPLEYFVETLEELWLFAQMESIHLVTYSMWPIMLNLLNLPRKIRNLFSSILLVGIVPANGTS